MIATMIVIRQRALRINGASELAPKNNQRIFEQSALFQIHHQRRTRLIHILALSADLLGKIAMLVPAAMHKLNKSNTALHHTASEEAVSSKTAINRIVANAIRLQDVRRLLRQIGEFRDRCLHPKCHLILSNPGLDLRIADQILPQLEFKSRMPSKSDRRLLLSIPLGFDK